MMFVDLTIDHRSELIVACCLWDCLQSHEDCQKTRVAIYSDADASNMCVKMADEVLFKVFGTINSSHSAYIVVQQVLQQSKVGKFLTEFICCFSWKDFLALLCSCCSVAAIKSLCCSHQLVAVLSKKIFQPSRIKQQKESNTTPDHTISCWSSCPVSPRSFRMLVKFSGRQDARLSSVQMLQGILQTDVWSL